MLPFVETTLEETESDPVVVATMAPTIMPLINRGEGGKVFCFNRTALTCKISALKCLKRTGPVMYILLICVLN